MEGDLKGMRIGMTISRFAQMSVWESSSSDTTCPATGGKPLRFDYSFSTNRRINSVSLADPTDLSVATASPTGNPSKTSLAAIGW